MNSLKRLRNTGAELHGIRLKADAEQPLVKTAQHPGNAPELAVRTEQQPFIQARFQKHVLLVRSTQQGGAHHAGERQGQGGLILHRGGGLRVIALQERPHGTVVVRRHAVRHLGMETGNAVHAMGEDGYHSGGMRTVSLPQKHAKQIAQGIHLFRQHGVTPAIQVLPVQGMLRNPEKPLDDGGQGDAFFLPFPRLLLQPQFPEHPCQNLAGLRMQNHGGKAA